MYYEQKFSKKEIKKFVENIDILYKDNKKEKFKQVIYNNYYTQYLISSFGRVVSTNYRGVAGRIKVLKPKMQNNGYLSLTICVNGKHKTVLIHRLVATAFIKKPNTKVEVNHKDGCKTNNCVDNLEWVTSKENIHHAINNNLKHILRGEEIKNSKYTEHDVKLVCECLENNIANIKTIANLTNVSEGMIKNILHHNSWTHVSVNYDIDRYNYGITEIEKAQHEDKIRMVCAMLESNRYTIKEISSQTEIGYGMVIKILNGECYKNISKKFKLSNYKSKANKSKNKN